MEWVSRKGFARQGFGPRQLHIQYFKNYASQIVLLGLLFLAYLLLILVGASPEAIKSVTSLVNDLNRCRIYQVASWDRARRRVDVGEAWIVQTAKGRSRNWTIILRLFLSRFRKRRRVRLRFFFDYFWGAWICCYGKWENILWFFYATESSNWFNYIPAPIALAELIAGTPVATTELAAPKESKL